MATGKRYYWIKLNRDFMIGDTVGYMMEQSDGAKFVVMYQMLCVAGINTNGRLESTIGEIIAPFTLPRIQRECKYFDMATVERGLELFKRLGLIYEDPDNTLVISNFSEMVGSETDWSAKKRRQRANVDNGGDNGGDNVPIDIRDKSIDIRDKSIDTEIERYTTTPIPPHEAHTIDGGGGLPPEIIAYAEEAARGADHPAAYKAAILDRIRTAGYTTLAEVKEADRQHKTESPPTPFSSAQPRRVGNETIL